MNVLRTDELGRIVCTLRQVIRWLRNQKRNEKFNYNASVNALKAEGPAGLYLIQMEDYLADMIFEEIKKLCITSGSR